METEVLISGSGKTTRIGYVNPNQQKCCGHRGIKGNDHLQYAYRMECLLCGNVYGANGSDIHLRKCPECQKGSKSIEF